MTTPRQKLLARQALLLTGQADIPDDDDFKWEVVVMRMRGFGETMAEAYAAVFGEQLFNLNDWRPDDEQRAH